MNRTGLIAKISIKYVFADMYLEIFLADFVVFRVFLGISQDFAEIPEFRGSATARNIRSPEIASRALKLLSHAASCYKFRNTCS